MITILISHRLKWLIAGSISLATIIIIAWPTDPDKKVWCGGSYPQMPIISCEVLRGNEKRVQRLIERGANLNAVSLNGFTPLRYAIDHERYSIARILVESGADPNDRFSITSISPLTRALIHHKMGNPASLHFYEYLMSNGADPLDRQCSALIWAARHGETDRLREMLELSLAKDPARFHQIDPIGVVRKNHRDLNVAILPEVDELLRRYDLASDDS